MEGRAMIGEAVDALVKLQEQVRVISPFPMNLNPPYEPL